VSRAIIARYGPREPRHSHVGRRLPNHQRLYGRREISHQDGPLGIQRWCAGSELRSESDSFSSRYQRILPRELPYPHKIATSLLEPPRLADGIPSTVLNPDLGFTLQILRGAKSPRRAKLRKNIGLCVSRIQGVIRGTQRPLYAEAPASRGPRLAVPGPLLRRGCK